MISLINNVKIFASVSWYNSIMENIDVFENEEYQKGAVSPNNWSNLINLIYINVFVMLNITVMMIFEPFIAIWYSIRNIFKMKSGTRKNISGQVALVTGSANGLGRAIAFRLAQENCHIAVADINLADAQRTARELSEIHRVKAVAYKVDVSDVLSIKQLKSDIESTLGPVDILVNNAGIMPVASFRWAPTSWDGNYVWVTLTLPSLKFKIRLSLSENAPINKFKKLST